MTETIDDTVALTVSLTDPVTPAKGKLIGYFCPASAEKGKAITINATMKNTGGTSGKFKLDVYTNDPAYSAYPVGGSGTFTLAAGATSASKAITTITPKDRTSVIYTLKCIRVT